MNRQRTRRRARSIGGSFSPLSLSPALWLDASRVNYQDSAGTTVAAADGDPVGQAFDYSGNGRHWTQGTAGNRPTLALAAQNGRNAFRFNGTSSFLSRANFFSTPPFTILAAFKFTDDNALRVALDVNGTGNNSVLLWASHSNAALGAGVNYGTGSSVATGCAAQAATNGVAGVMAVRASAGGAILGRWSGTQFLSASNASISAVQASHFLGCQAGTTRFALGDFFELAVVLRDLSDAEVAQGEAAIKAKWGIA